MSQHVSFIDIVKQHIESSNLILPVFSSSAIKLHQELIKKEPDLKIVEKLINIDQSLSSQILKTANSSFYRGLSEILTIKAAIVRLGIQEIGKLALLTSSKSQFRSSDKLLNIMMKKLWQHSIGVGLGAHLLAKRCALNDVAEHAFFAGLFHDVGKLFILLVLDDLKKKKKSLNFSPSLILEAVNDLHTEQGYLLMQKWNIPEQYCLIARDHHQDPLTDADDSLMLLVRLANMACAKLGIGFKSAPELDTSSSQEAEILNLTEQDLAEMEVKLEDTKILANQ